MLADLAKKGMDPCAGGSGQRKRSPVPAAPPTLQVLADLGDGQSLQQSLSTFSGHVRRIRNILAATTPRSLVLLDEVGGRPGRAGVWGWQGRARGRRRVGRKAGEVQLCLQRLRLPVPEPATFAVPGWQALRRPQQPVAARPGGQSRAAEATERARWRTCLCSPLLRSAPALTPPKALRWRPPCWTGCTTAQR